MKHSFWCHSYLLWFLAASFTWTMGRWFGCPLLHSIPSNSLPKHIHPFSAWYLSITGMFYQHSHLLRFLTAGLAWTFFQVILMPPPTPPIPLTLSLPTYTVPDTNLSKGFSAGTATSLGSLLLDLLGPLVGDLAGDGVLRIPSICKIHNSLPNRSFS